MLVYKTWSFLFCFWVWVLFQDMVSWELYCVSVLLLWLCASLFQWTVRVWFNESCWALSKSSLQKNPTELGKSNEWIVKTHSLLPHALKTWQPQPIWLSSVSRGILTLKGKLIWCKQIDSCWELFDIWWILLWFKWYTHNKFIASFKYMRVLVRL
jgi:hypothetical protein